MSTVLSHYLFLSRSQLILSFSFQLYESAKKIETLELTKLEMKEQLELLDFQIVEVENQKAMVNA